MSTLKLTTNKTHKIVVCNICLQMLDIRHATKTICGHYYHKNCLCKWFNSRLHLSATCPTCRGNLQYDKGIVTYYDFEKTQLKLIQNSIGDYLFYPDGNKMYFLKINRKNDTIIGGLLYNRNNTESKKITEEMIERHQNKFDGLRFNDTNSILKERIIEFIILI